MGGEGMEGEDQWKGNGEGARFDKVSRISIYSAMVCS